MNWVDYCKLLKVGVEFLMVVGFVGLVGYLGCVVSKFICIGFFVCGSFIWEIEWVIERKWYRESLKGDGCFIRVGDGNFELVWGLMRVLLGLVFVSRVFLVLFVGFFCLVYGVCCIVFSEVLDCGSVYVECLLWSIVCVV